MATRSYACKDYPGMEACPARFEAASDDELMKHIELHAAVAHQEDPGSWPSEERSKLKSLMKTVKSGGR
jgi:hypothetical protein